MIAKHQHLCPLPCHLTSTLVLLPSADILVRQMYLSLAMFTETYQCQKGFLAKGVQCIKFIRLERLQGFNLHLGPAVAKYHHDNHDSLGYR